MKIHLPIQILESPVEILPYQPWWGKDLGRRVRKISRPGVYAVVLSPTCPADGMIPSTHPGLFLVGETTNLPKFDRKGGQSRTDDNGEKVYRDYILEKNTLINRFQERRGPIVQGYKELNGKASKSVERHNKLAAKWKSFAGQFGEEAIQGKTWFTVLLARPDLQSWEIRAWLKTVESLMIEDYAHTFKRLPVMVLNLDLPLGYFEGSKAQLLREHKIQTDLEINFSP